MALTSRSQKQYTGLTSMISLPRTPNCRTLRPHLALSVAAVIIGVLAIACGSPSSLPGTIHVVEVNGNVSPVMARFIDRAIDTAVDSEAAAVVIQLDTPGGLSASMDDIVQDILTADIPVIVYVYPPGGRAASAGTLITLAGHVAAMAPGTSIGAATPVDVTGDDIDSSLEDKVINDTAARFHAIAEQRGRNGKWAQDSVLKAASLSANEAVSMNVVDLVAPRVLVLLEEIDGQKVELHSGTSVTLETADAPLVEVKPNIGEQILRIISDPNIAFLLISLGSVAIFIELLNPGLILPGVFGILSLILGFFSLSIIPFDWAGIGLILAAFTLFFLEIFVTSGGILTIGGLVSLILGSIFLTSGNPEGFQVSSWLVFGLSGTISSYFILASVSMIRDRRLKPTVGIEFMVGQGAVARSDFNPTGYVMIEGEYWQAKSKDSIKSGDNVVIIAIEGFKLTVQKRKDGFRS